jgi:FlaA1/EpsC-like NDP-sugar epimerase
MLRNDGFRLFVPAGGTVSLIVGANDLGEALLRAIRQRSTLPYRIVGFVDERPNTIGQQIAGVPVLGRCADIPQLAQRFHVEEVLIASGELPGKQVRQLVENGRECGFQVKVVPSYEQVLSDRVAMRPREVAIEDLLCREPVQLDMDSIRDWLTGRVVMVTGSAGSIGSEICRQLLKLNPAKLVLVDRSETGQFFLEHELQRISAHDPPAQIDVRLADLTDHNRLSALFEETQPEIIFHAAAYKHVPLMESHCGEAVKNIVLATRNLVELADQHGAHALV